MFYSDDPAADYDRYCAHQEKELERLPICDGCGERITDDYLYEIGGQLFCEECMNECRTAVENYVN